jgi:hypothetical protein
MLAFGRFLQAPRISACMDGIVAWFTDHEGFPVQATHRENPIWDVASSFGVFSLDIFELSHVANFKVVCVFRRMTAKFALTGIDPIKYLVPLWDHCFPYEPRF